MNGSQQPQKSLRGLLEGLCEDTLTAEEAAKLDGILADDATARQFYRQFMGLHAELLCRFKTSAQIDPALPLAVVDGTNPAIEPTIDPALEEMFAFGRSKSLANEPVKHHSTRGRRAVVWASIAAGLLFAAYFVGVSWNMISERWNNQPLVVEQKVDAKDAAFTTDSSAFAEPLATMRSLATDVDAANPDAPISLFGSARQQIADGLVEVQLKRGAVAVIEGPAVWSVANKNQLRLERGRLVATVPKQATGFIVETPTAKIVDLGTVFGVEVEASGTSEVHVIKGLVDVQTDQDVQANKPLRLQAGEAARVEPRPSSPTVTIEKLPADPARFPPQAPDRALSELGSRYADCVLALKPLAYFRVEGTEELAIEDRAGDHFIAKFARTEGPGENWEKSPFGHAMRFRGTKFCDRVTIEPNATQPPAVPLDFSQGTKPGLPFTIALWARCQLGQHTGLLVGKGAGFQEQFLFDILNARYRFVVISSARNGGGEVSSKSVFDGTWQHVAAVFDPEQKQISIYVNGKLEASAELKDTSLFATNEATYIGNRPFHGDNFKLTLDGGLAEIAIFPQALTSDDIYNLFNLKFAR